LQAFNAALSWVGRCLPVSISVNSAMIGQL
jgi:hypothetical protein